MSSFPSRHVEVWKSSLAESITPISGAFSFELLRTLMVPETLQFLAEKAGAFHAETGEFIDGFLQGMKYANPKEPRSLLYWKRFENAQELYSCEVNTLSNAIRQLELHTDINLTFNRITYLADVGVGPQLPLLIFARLPIARGVAFEIDERGTVGNSFKLGDFHVSDKAQLAHQHYSTGMALLAGEDSVAGLIDASFMQFYLAVEAILEKHERDAALQNGNALFGAQFHGTVSKIVSHVYVARQRFFGHAHPKFLKGLLDREVAFDIAKQALVARWCARALLELELKRPLVKREMRLYSDPHTSIMFSGSSAALDAEFALPN